MLACLIAHPPPHSPPPWPWPVTPSSCGLLRALSSHYPAKSIWESTLRLLKKSQRSKENSHLMGGNVFKHVAAIVSPSVIILLVLKGQNLFTIKNPLGMSLSLYFNFFIFTIISSSHEQLKLEKRWVFFHGLLAIKTGDVDDA